ncbi:MAG: hypothetical protein AABZ60_25055 [Planctomycetota bacterium]
MALPPHFQYSSHSSQPTPRPRGNLSYHPSSHLQNQRLASSQTQHNPFLAWNRADLINYAIALEQRLGTCSGGPSDGGVNSNAGGSSPYTPPKNPPQLEWKGLEERRDKGSGNQYGSYKTLKNCKDFEIFGPFLFKGQIIKIKKQILPPINPGSEFQIDQNVFTFSLMGQLSPTDIFFEFLGIQKRDTSKNAMDTFFKNSSSIDISTSIKILSTYEHYEAKQNPEAIKMTTREGGPNGYYGYIYTNFTGVGMDTLKSFIEDSQEYRTVTIKFDDFYCNDLFYFRDILQISVDIW